MGMSARERVFNNRRVNPVMIALITRGLGPSTYAVLETTGRKSGRKRLVPVAAHHPHRPGLPNLGRDDQVPRRSSRLGD